MTLDSDRKCEDFFEQPKEYKTRDSSVRYTVEFIAVTCLPSSQSFLYGADSLLEWYG